jgi:hypothetical protein
MKSFILVLMVIGAAAAEQPVSTPLHPIIYPGLPQATVPLIEQSAVIDGKLDDAVWSKAEKLRAFCPNNGSPVPTAPETQAWIYSTKTELYLALRAMESDMAGLIGNDKQASWTDDLFEIFLSPGDRPGIPYHQFQINSLGRYNDEYNRMILWDIKNMSIAAGAEKNAWTIELSIPFASLEGAGEPSARGVPWRFNILRSRPMHEGDANGDGAMKIAKSGEKYREETSWSPTQGETSHMPEMFGYLFIEAYGAHKP